MQSIKCVLVGDMLVGVTCLLVTYVTDTFPHETCLTITDNHPKLATIGGEQYNLQLYEASGSEDYDRLRTLMYPGTDVALVCFSVVKPSSFENVIEKWIPEIKHNCPGCPYLLVGLKTDLRNDPYQKPIPPERAEELARHLNAVAYVECSALTKKGVQHVFDQLVSAALQPKKRRSKCELL